MSKFIFGRRNIAVLLTTLAAAGAIAGNAVATPPTPGRTLVGAFGFDTAQAGGTSYYQQCGPPANAGFSIVLTEDGQPVTSLRPGTYWLTVTDNCPNHNFVLRSCPGSDSPCDPTSGGIEQEITPVYDPNTADGETGTVMMKIHLVHGTYRLFCDALHPVTGEPHEIAFDMYTDFTVGGADQIG